MRARARDVYGAATGWSGWKYFTVDSKGPGQVYLSSSTHPGTVWYDRDLRVTWSHAPVAGAPRWGYLVLVNGSSSSTPTLTNHNELVTSPEYTLPRASQPRGTVWVHVRPVDRLGNYGPVSRYRVNLGSMDPAATPQVADPDGSGALTNPATGGTWTRWRRPRLSATYGHTHTSGKVGFRVETASAGVIWETTDPSSTNVSDGTRREVRVPEDLALDDGDYRLRVKAVGSNGLNSPWMPAQHFSVDQTPPTTVSLTSSTHPDDTLWYDRRDLRVDWDDAIDTGVGRWGYLVIVDDKPATVPTTTSVGETPEGQVLAGLSDDPFVELPAASQPTGVTFVHVRPIDLLGNHGSTSHMQVNLGSFDPSLEALGDEEFATWSGGVNAPFGNFVDSAEDVSVASLGPDLSVQRTYNSRSKTIGPFGWGWTFGFGSLIQELDDDKLAVLRPDGDVTVFTPDGAGGFTTEAGDFSRLESAGSGHTLTLPDGTTYHYNAGGALDRIVAEGHELDLVYDTDGRLTQAVDTSSGRSLSFAWTDGTITEVATDPIATHGGQLRWRYHYSTDGTFLEQVCGPTDVERDTGRCVVYDRSDNKISSVTQPSGDTTLRVGYATDGRVAWREDGLGNRTEFTHPSAGTTHIELPSGGAKVVTYDEEYRTLTETSPEGRTTSYEYDASGNRTAIVDGAGTRQELAYDALGNVVVTRCVACHADGTDVTTYSDYDDMSRVTAERDGRSSGPTDDTYATTFTYDADGRLLTEATPPVPGVGDGIVEVTNTYTDGTEAATDGGTVPSGLLATSTDANGNTTTFGYEADGDLAREQHPGGMVVEYTHDELGRRISMSETTAAYPAGLVTTYVYDERGNETRVTEPTATNRITGVDSRLRTVHTYDADDNVITTVVTDEVGGDARTTRFTYDGMDRQLSVEDPEGGLTSRGYDAAGNVLWVTDAEGRTLRTLYDQDGLATAVQLLAAGADPADAGAPVDTTISATNYDAAGRAVTETDANGAVREHVYDGQDNVLRTRLRGWWWPDGTTSTVTLTRTDYDKAGNAVRVEEGQDQAGDPLRVATSDVDAADRVTSTTLDPGGLDRTTTYLYDGNGNITSESVSQDGRTEQTRTAYGVHDQPETQTVENGAEDLTTRWSYDQRGNPTEITGPAGTVLGDPDATTIVDYDEAGRAWRTTGPRRPVSGDGSVVSDGRPVMRTGYDAFGNTSHEEAADGSVTTTSYDRLDRRIRIDHPSITRADATTITPSEAFGYDMVGNLTSRTTRRGATWDYAFDRRNRVVTETGPAAQPGDPRGVSATEYDGNGNVTATVDPTGARTEHTYDLLGRLDTTTQVVRTGAGSDRHVTDHWVDLVGNETTTVDPAGNTTTRVFDAAGDVSVRTDEVGEVWQVERDLAGRVLTRTAPTGPVDQFVYDLAGRVVETRKLDRTSAAVLSSTATTYDASGNATQVVSAEGRTVTAAYTTDGLLLSSSQAVAGDPITTEYRYDVVGNLTGVVDGNGNLTTYGYNAWGLRDSMVEPSTAEHPSVSDRTWTTLYDAGGLPVEVRQPGGVVVTSTFDALGRQSATHGAGGGVPAASTATAWDLAGRRASVSHPGGEIVIDHDDRGLVTEVTGPAGGTSYTYDELGREIGRTDPAGAWAATWTDRSELATVTDPVTGGTTTYGWDDAGRPTGATFGDGSTSLISYDTHGRREADVWSDDAGVEVQAHRYGYDADDQLISRTVTGSQVTDAVHGYGYDDAGRLTSWSSPAGTVAYTWDGAGNRTSAGGDVYSYDERNRLVSGPAGAYAHTARGDQESVTGPAGTASWVFDGLGRNVSHTTADGTTATTTFDGLARIATRDGTGFSYTGLALDPTSDGTAVYGRDPAGRLVSVADAAGARHAGLDRHGDLVGLYDAAGVGTVAGGRVYDPFGEVAAADGTFGQVALGFQADWTDAASGEVWQGARWYQPSTGRFTSRDTVFGELATPVTLNRYLYGQADPLRYFDPDGRYGFDGTYTIHKADYKLYKPARRTYEAATRRAKAKYRVRQQMQERFATVLRHEAPPRARRSSASSTRSSPPPPTARQATARVRAMRSSGGYGSRPDNAPIVRGRPYFGGVVAADPRVSVPTKLATSRSALERHSRAVAAHEVSRLGHTPNLAATLAIEMVVQPLLNVAECGYYRQRCGAAAAEVGMAVVGGTAVKATFKAGKAGIRAIKASSRTRKGVAGGTSRAPRPTGLLDDACRVNSFVPGTLVLMADGTTMAIEDIEIGDWVWATDPESGEAGRRQITDTIVGDGTKHLVDIAINGATITATDGHPFWVDDHGAWVDAEDLEAGDLLVLADGTTVDVDAIAERSGVLTVHNLTVDGIHTYHVMAGDDPVLVHNCRRPWALTREGASAARRHDGFGTFYKSSSDGTWWVRDTAGHGGSAFKVYEETATGLRWRADADAFGDFIDSAAKHKGQTGRFISWGDLHS